MNARGRRVEHDVVTNLDIAQRPEERIAVAGNGYIPRLARKRRALDVPEADAKRAVVGTLKDDR
jgi:hypothetical protein